MHLNYLRKKEEKKSKPKISGRRGAVTMVQLAICDKPTANIIINMES